MRLAVAAIAMGLALGSCGGAQPRVASSSAAAVLPAAGDQMPLQLLPPQTLAAQQCALFLWQKSEQPRRILMALDTPPIARVQIDGRLIDLPRIEISGDLQWGHFPHAVYSGSGLTLRLDLVIEDRERLIGGALVPEGSLSIERENGWSMIVPVAGMIACQ